MGIATGIGVAGAIGAVGSVASSAIGANAATTAAGQQVNEEQQALALTQANQAPFIQAGQQSIGQIMSALSSGKFGPGSIGPTPTPTTSAGNVVTPTALTPGALPTAPSGFVAPTAAQAQQYPGYQFELAAGNQGILQGAAASGGNISGATDKALEGYDVNLANTTYQSQFNQALQSYNAGLAGYAANLQGYQTGLAAQGQSYGQQYANQQLALGAQQQQFGQETSAFSQGLAAQQQEFGQLATPAEIGENANVTQNQTISQLMQAIGGAQSAGTVGAANAISGGVTGVTNNLTQTLLLSQLLGGGTTSAAPTSPGVENPLYLPPAPSPYSSVNIGIGSGPT